MRFLSVLVVAALLVSCTTSSGIQATGPDTYGLSMSRAAGLDREVLNARMRKTAEDFCAKNGLKAQELNAVEAGDSKSGALRDRSSMVFKCVAG